MIPIDNRPLPPPDRHRLGARIAVLLVVVALSACVRPYKIDIQQGNVVTDEELARLETGMTKREVRFVMGTPLIEDPFHQDRWDYYYSFKPGRSKEREQHAITLVFDNDRLDRIEGIDGREQVDARQVDPPEEEEKKGFFKRLFSRDKEKPAPTE